MLSSCISDYPCEGWFCTNHMKNCVFCSEFQLCNIVIQIANCRRSVCLWDCSLPVSKLDKYGLTNFPLEHDKPEDKPLSHSGEHMNGGVHVDASTLTGKSQSHVIHIVEMIYENHLHVHHIEKSIHPSINFHYTYSTCCWLVWPFVQGLDFYFPYLAIGGFLPTS